MIEYGCPLANGHAPCPMCGGYWGGDVTHVKMLRALESGRLRGKCLGCDVLQRQAEEWYRAHGSRSVDGATQSEFQPNETRR